MYSSLLRKRELMMQLALLCTRYDSIDTIRIGDLGPLNVRHLNTARRARLASSERAQCIDERNE